MNTAFHIVAITFVSIHGGVSGSAQDGEAKEVKELLKGIIIPEIDFQEIPPADCVEFIQMRAVELHAVAGGDPRDFGEIMSKNPPKSVGDLSAVDSSTPITLYRTNVSAWDALVAVTSKMNVAIRFDAEGKMYFQSGTAEKKRE